MCSTQQLSLPCPLCCHPNFSSVDSLRTSLVNVTNRPLMCPICNEIQIGLDKLTIHLFSHSMQQSTMDGGDGSLDQLSPPPSSSMYLKVESDNVDPPFPKAEEPSPFTATIEPKATDSLKMVRRRRSKIANNQSVSQIDLSSYPTSSPPLPSVAIAIEQVQCYICGYLFRTKELQRMHLQLVHEIFVAPTAENNAIVGIGANRFNCDYCSKYFKNKGSVRLHLRMVHGVGVFGVAASINQRTSDSTEDAIKMKSMSTTGSINSDMCPDQSPDASGDSSSVDPKSWECDVCNKSFTTKYFLKKHKRLHTGRFGSHLISYRKYGDDKWGGVD